MGKRKVAIIGGSGYGAGELIRRLLLHPEVELCRVASIDYVGDNLAAAHPNLEGLTELNFEKLPPEEAAKGMDIVLLGLPHKVSSGSVPAILPTGATVIDLSGDFRLKDREAYETYYKTTHPCPELLATSVYGLPELYRKEIATAKLVASPGCFATCIALGLLPLAQKGWLEGSVETVACTGSSGSGAAPQAGTHHPVRAVNLKTYKPMVHQHTPEIVQTLSAAGAKDFHLAFVPISAPLSRGIFATSFARVDPNVSEAQIAAAFAEAYEHERFVRRPANRLPEVAAISGTNYAEVSFAYGDVVGGKRIVSCFSALDNLIKGGAGQAIQSMNIVLGVDEATTLADAGGWP